jgi:hypothetical protein
MEGIYTTPPLPDDLDLKTASDATLLQYGLRLPRPKAGDPPAIVAAWNRVCEHGLQMIAPQLKPLANTLTTLKRGPRPRGGSGGAPVAGTNWCGGVLEGPGNWRGVTGTFSLPYLSVPSQGLGSNQTQSFSAWVALDGWGSFNLFQACLGFFLDTTTSPPSTLFATPVVEWWVPNQDDPSQPPSTFAWGYTVNNAPAMQSGDLVQIYCGYFTALDGQKWGSFYFLFLNDLVLEPVPKPVSRKGPPRIAQVPIMINMITPAPAGALCPGDNVEWIMELESGVVDQAGVIVPVFSASADSITPVTFTQAIAYGQTEGVTGDPVNGFPLDWSATDTGQLSNDALVTLSSETVSILYTGPA